MTKITIYSLNKTQGDYQQLIHFIVKKNKKIGKKLTKKIWLVFLLMFLTFITNEKILLASSKCNKLNEEEKKLCLKQEIKKTYEDIIDLKINQKKTLDKQLVVLDQEQARNQTELTIAQRTVLNLDDQIQDLTEKISVQEKEIVKSKAFLSIMMQAYYEYDQSGILGIVLANEDFSEILSDPDYVEQSSLKLKDILGTIKNDKAELENQKNKLDEKKKEHERIKSNLAVKKNELQYTENKKQELLGQTISERKKYEDLLDKIEDEIYDLESGKTINYANLPPAKDGYLDYPVASVRVTQKYGMTSYAKKGAYGGNPHNGIDFGISSGSNVFAARTGKIIGSGNNGRYAYGKWIAIDHGDGLVTLYGHLSKQLVSKGESVKGGEKIALSGNTGNSTGPHVHFSVFSAKSFEVAKSKYVSGLYIPIGYPVNPRWYLK
ncbi:MAG: hypothetical protein COU40_02100 [Candidatus Moranbacteria bacterium CG10_big_fil_rev_8_21_14_0_10_35_21]|nr:MAG: hypothetical protein COU40_02100 [Candidatus Moranbacteria bacterium CG10_big_fil_rev_8_21_14_0_10_35_21]PJA88591.1 MAG: hypothetical protein CO139_02260 [Candidatus Moranbacteria bacterium CG_4_9_14_3_um_filter_36_9]